MRKATAIRALLSVHGNAEGARTLEDAAPEDMEPRFGNLHGSDTQFAVAVKNWQVVDAYGAD